MGYLVDTNIIVDVTRGSTAAADYLDTLGAAWSISMITCLELLAGARTQRESVNLDLVLSGYRAIPPNEQITRRAYYLIKTYARSHALDTLDAHRRHSFRRRAHVSHEEPKALPNDQ
jgi:predicted nucleic acid-binding protein